jgi:hypothetical protein
MPWELATSNGSGTIAKRVFVYGNFINISYADVTSSFSLTGIIDGGLQRTATNLRVLGEGNRWDLLNETLTVLPPLPKAASFYLTFLSLTGRQSERGGFRHS